MSHVRAIPGGERVPVPSQRKAVLFCPRCGHRSSVGGDWELVVRADGTEIHCPSCRRLITSRPR